MTIKQLDKWLSKNNITSMQLAELLGLSRYAISKWRERGFISPKQLPRIQAIAERHPRYVPRMLDRRRTSLFE